MVSATPKPQKETHYLVAAEAPSRERCERKRAGLAQVPCNYAVSWPEVANDIGVDVKRKSLMPLVFDVNRLAQASGHIALKHVFSLLGSSIV